MNGVNAKPRSIPGRNSEESSVRQEAVNSRQTLPPIGPGGRLAPVRPEIITKEKLALMCGNFKANRQKLAADVRIDASSKEREALVESINEGLCQKHGVISLNDANRQRRAINELNSIKRSLGSMKMTAEMTHFKSRVKQLRAQLQAVKLLSPGEKAGDLRQHVMTAVPDYTANFSIQKLVDDLNYVAKCGEGAGDIDLHIALNRVPSIMRELGMEHTTKLLGEDLMKEFDAVRHAPISIKDIESEERAKWWETERFGSDYNVSIAEDKKSLIATLKR